MVQLNFDYKGYHVSTNPKGQTYIINLSDNTTQIIAGDGQEAKRVINAILKFPEYDR